jgi:hypothetical protein
VKPFLVAQSSSIGQAASLKLFAGSAFITTQSCPINLLQVTSYWRKLLEGTSPTQ